MNFVQLRISTVAVAFSTLLLGVYPHTIISEPRGKVSTASESPLTILYSGITKLDTDSALLLRIDSGNSDDLVSICDDNRIVIEQKNETSTIQWKPSKNCTVPLVSYKGKNYILPISRQNISLDILSDISTDTLRNTLAISTLINTDTRLASLRTKKIIRNINSVLQARNTPLMLPLTWVPVPEKDTFLPSSPRPYRASVTDGVHHGWDFYTTQGKPVHAVEEWQIVHVKRDFSWNEMNNLFDPDTELARQENLDIYRGNTVYLKTLSGHIAIYAHMTDIPAKLAVGDYVAAGTIIGHVGDSAVPDKKYLYHLHFELWINPFEDEKAGTYTFEDYLMWPWFWKGKNTAWVKENDDSIFQ